MTDFVPAKSRASGAVQAGRWRELKSNGEVSYHLIPRLDSQLTVGPAGAMLTQSRGLLSQTSVIRCRGPLGPSGEQRHQDRNHFGFCCCQSSSSRPSPTQSFGSMGRPSVENCLSVFPFMFVFLGYVFPPSSLKSNVHLSCLRTLLCWCKRAPPPSAA